jgi:hypothetical protein
MKIRRLFSTALIAGLAAAALAGCASSPGHPPHAAMQKASYAIGNANQSKAGRYAKMEMYKARQELKKAKSLVNKNEPTHHDYVAARRLAQKATVDAQLATARGGAKAARKQAERVQSNLRALKKQAHHNVEGAE